MANSKRKKKKSSWGCLWFFLLLIFLGFASSIVLGGGVLYLGMQARENPQKFLKEYQPVIRQAGDSAVGLLSSDKPLVDEDLEFDADAYNDFVQKVGQFQQIINDPNASDVPMRLEYSAKELIHGLMQDLARYEVTRYDLNFEPGLLHAKAAIKGEVLIPLIPKEVPDVLRKSLETLQWINVDTRLAVEFDESLTLLSVDSLQLGDFKVSQFLLQKLNEYLESQRLYLSQQLIGRLRQARVKPQKIRLTKDLISFEGLYNPSQ